MKIYAKHLPYENGHLGEVIEQMKVLGAPVIKCIKFNEEYYALEGSHRLAACSYLGLTPIIDLVQESKEAIVPKEHWTKVAKNAPCYTYEKE